MKENRFASEFNISEPIVKSLEAMGYHEPMEVQARVIKDIQAGRDLIVQSKTGSGKTAAFGIPIADMVLLEENRPQALVLTPTRELAVQVCEELADIGKYKKIRTLPVYGKQPIHIQLRQLKQRVHIIVGTPGRLLDLIKKKQLRLDGIRFFVIDEADELLKRGFLDDVESIIQKMPEDTTTLLFSATMPKEIEELCTVYMHSPDRVEVASDELGIQEIKQTYLSVSDEWKFKLLRETIEDRKPYSCMIFCNTRAKVDDLLKKLKVGRYSCAALHGAMIQKERLKSIAAFKQGKVQFLVCTDLAGRGIHVDRLDLVINYNVPPEPENYVHRIGRTGRAGENGEAITFVNAYDRKQWAEIQNFIGYTVPERKIEAPKEIGTVMKKRTKESNNKHSDICRLRINIGRKKKLRSGDVLGAISNLPGLSAEDIGIINIQDTCTYIEIHNDKGEIAFRNLGNARVKGKTVTVKMMKGL